jgi:hypothetical protein
MFGLDKKIKSAAAAGGAMALGAAVALLGLVWLSIAAVTALSKVTTPVAAMCIVGAIAMTPMVVMLLRHRPASKEKEPPQPEPVQAAEEAAAVIRLAHSAHMVAERSPLAGIALTLGAAFLAARSPSTSPLAMHMLAEAVERWVQSRPAREANGEAHDAHGAFTEHR